ncbi:MAG: hypothetical protein ACI3V4_07385 [Faecousia sp.]
MTGEQLKKILDERAAAREQNMAEASQIREQAKDDGKWPGNQTSGTAQKSSAGSGQMKQTAQISEPAGELTGEALIQDTKARAREHAQSPKAKAYEAEKAYNDYLKSDERKQTISKMMAEDTAAMLMNGLPGIENFRPSVDEKEGYLKAQADYWKEQAKQEEDRAVLEKDLEELQSWSEEDQQALKRYITGRDVDFYETLSPNSNGIRIGNAELEATGLFQKYGKQKVDELAESYSRLLSYQETQNTTQQAQESAGSGFWAGLGHSVASVGANLAGGASGLAGYAKELGQQTGRYSTLDPNNTGMLLSNYAGAVRGEVAKNIEGEDGENGVLGKVGSVLYQGAMSAADSIARVAAFGGTGSLGLAAVNSFSQTLSDASRQGATPQQAAILATANAAVETLSEKIPLDNLLATAKAGKQPIGEIVKRALAQAGIEATTEEISLVGEFLNEAAILREKSSYNQKIADLVANGMSYNEAKAQASKAVWDEAVNTFFVSAASGGMSSAGGSLFANVTSQDVAQETAQQPESVETVQEPIQTENAVPEAEAPTDIISETVEKLKTNGTVSNKQAEAILADPEALKLLAEQTGVEPSGTKSQKRDAVKQAIRQLAGEDIPTTMSEAGKQSFYDDLYQDLWENNPAAQEQANQQQEQWPRTMQETTGIPSKAQTVDTAAEPDTEASDGLLFGNTPAEFLSSGDSDTKGGEWSVGAANKNFTGTAAYDELLSDQNAQRDRPNDVRPVEVPKDDAQGKKVSEFVGNAYGSALTPDSFIPTIKKLVMDGSLSHDVQTNEKSLELAAQDIATDGIYRSVQNVRDTARSGKTSADDVAKATLLYNYLVENTDQQSQEYAADVFASLSQLATNSGRSLQLFNMFRQMTPDGQMKTIQNEITQYTNRLKRLGNIGQNFTPQIDDALFQEFRDAAEANRSAKTPQEQADTQRRMRDAQNAIYKNVAAQMPSTFKAKWDAWRYMAMMGNVKTNVRNIAGNLAFVPYTEAKRVMGAAFEKLLPKGQRTKSVLNPLSSEDRQLRNWAQSDAKTVDVNDALKYSAKLGDDTSMSVIRENQRVFKNGILEGARKLTEALPANGDMLFKNREYSVSLAGFLKARGYSYADVQSGNIDTAVLGEGRNYAINEAMKATFNDCNAFSDFLANDLRYKGDNPVGKALNILGEGVMPFRRTPANIVVRMVENSPVGLVKGAWNMATQVHQGNVSAATAIDQLAAGLTGTGAMVLGYALAKGVGGVRLRGSAADEDEERQGFQAYSIEFSIGGQEYSYTIDWAAPANLPLFVGANIYSLMENAGADTGLSKFTSFLYSIGTMLEPMLSLSCMSSLNDILEAGKYAGDGEAIYNVLSQAATSYFTQGIPSLARQTAQALQKNKQSTFANSSDPLLRDLERKAAGIPFAGSAFQTDTVNEWGETESRGNAFERVFNAYFNPGTLKAIDNSALEQEVSRLNESQPDSVTPPDTAKTISYTDADGERHSNQRLTEEEYNTLATVQGQTAKAILEQTIESDIYKAMTDEQKAKVFDYVYDYAREKGRTEALDGYPGMDSWMKDIDGKESKAILDKVMTASFTDAFSDLTDSWANGGDGEGAVSSLDQAYSVYEGMSAMERRVFRDNAAGRLGYYLEAKKAGVSTETFTELYRTFYDIDKRTDINTGEKAKEWSYALEKAEEAREITSAQKYTLKDSMVYYQMFPAQTEKFDQMTEAGVSADSAKIIGSLLDGITGTGSIDTETGNANVRDIDKWEAIAKSGLTDSEIDTIMHVYMPDTGNTELKYDTIRDLGFSAEEYADSYRAYLDNSKKADKIAAIQQELGCDYNTANTLYRIYCGSSFK